MIKTNTIEDNNYSVSYEYIPLTATDEQIALAKEFGPKYAAKRLKTYEERNQDNLKNITNQAISSKIFEFMIYNHVKDSVNSGEVIPPSCEIYTKPTFDDDLVVIGENKKIKIHVKSHDRKRIWRKRPLSWAFQKNDPLFKYKANDILVLGVYVNEREGHLIAKDYVHKFKSSLAPAKNTKLVSKEFVYFDSKNKAFSLRS